MDDPYEKPFAPTADEQRKIAILMEVTDKMAKFTSPFLCSIAGIISHDEGDHIGTGTFITIGGNKYLFTAAHVACEAEAAKYTGVAHSLGNARPYMNVAGSFRKNHDLDIAYAPVNFPGLPDSDRSSCPEELVGPSLGVEKDWLFIHGLPGSSSPYFRMSKAVHSRTLPYGTVAETPKWSQFNPKVHFASRYEPRDQMYADGTPAELPNPSGLSGVAVWNTRRGEKDSRWTPADARVAGIVHRWDTDARCLIATKIEAILEWMRHL